MFRIILRISPRTHERNIGARPNMEVPGTFFGRSLFRTEPGLRLQRGIREEDSSGGRVLRRRALDQREVFPLSRSTTMAAPSST